MAVTAAQTILFFKDADGNGWSERFWYSGTLNDPDFTANINILVSARVGMLTNTSTCTHVRVQSNQRRAPFIFALAAGGTPGNETPPTAPAEVALLTRMTTNAVPPVANKAFLRGIPQRVVQADTYVPDAAFTTEFANFGGVLQNGNWQIVSSIQAFVNSPQPITQLNPTSPRGITFVAAAALFPIGSVIRIRGAKVPGYNGLKKIVMVNAAGTTYTCGGASPPVNDTGIAPTATLVTYDQTPITRVFVEGVSRRAAGRPFGQSRGRKPTLYSLRQ